MTDTILTVATGSAAAPFPSRRAAAALWLRVGLLSFGGPAGQIALMHRMVVEERRWISDRRFLAALNYCMILPGPEAQQLAIYIGWLLHGVRGGLIAGILFVLPGAIAVLALSILYVQLGHLEAVQGLFFGLKAAVLALVVAAVVRVGSRTLRNPPLVAIAVAAFVALSIFAIPFPIVIVIAAAIGLAGGLLGWKAFRGGGHGSDGEALADTLRPPRAAGALWAAAGALVLWLAPVAALLLVLGPDNTFTDIGIFFSQMAMVTFGGAYAVLAYVAQESVATYGWLTAPEMVDGLGLAETTPGPLILVLQFVGFLAGYRDGGTLPPLLAGTLGAALATWVTFAPCFLWIFLGAPFMERLTGRPLFQAPLNAVTAAVVGVIASLALWFGTHVLFATQADVEILGFTIRVPVAASLNPAALLLAVAAGLALMRWKIGTLIVLACTAAAGIALHSAGLG